MSEVYVGVYLEVDQFIETTRHKRVCENGHEGKRIASDGSMDFCGQCGTRFERKPYTIKERMTVSDAVEEFGLEEDTFVDVTEGSKKPHIWVGNLLKDNWAGEEEAVVEITALAIAEEYQRFLTAYFQPLELLKKNEVDFEIKFGTVVYYF